MPFKINIADKDGKTYKFELESEELIGKEIGQQIEGKELLPTLDGYEFQITGASDKAGFPAFETVEGVGLKRVLLTFGKGMNKRPKHEGKRAWTKNRPKGLRLRKTQRGKIISTDIVQINLKIAKHGNTTLKEIFPDQNQPKEKKKVEVAA
ncbi:MAG: S6e family ribosomal protein [Nanoarchaeota archaeon]